MGLKSSLQWVELGNDDLHMTAGLGHNIIVLTPLGVFASAAFRRTKSTGSAVSLELGM